MNNLLDRPAGLDLPGSLDSPTACIELTTPSHAEPRAGAATEHEVKFLLSRYHAAGVHAWAADNLEVDSFAEADTGLYSTSSIYLDTDDMDVYRETPGYRRCKLRIRRYGRADVAYLEQKCRKGNHRVKRRTAVDLESLARLDDQPDASSETAWFHEMLIQQGLRPRMLVYYERAAFTGMTDQGPVRLTMDRSLASVPVARFGFDLEDIPRTILPDHVIVELKYGSVKPPILKHLVKTLRLAPTSVSKYRRCVTAWGGESLRRTELELD